MHSMQLKNSTLLTMLCTIFFSLWGGFLIVNPALADDISVCSSGCDYDSIQQAISAATSGDRVVVEAGTYNEQNIRMKDGVDVVSQGNNDETVYDDPWSTYSTMAYERATLTIIHGNGTDRVFAFPDVDATLDGFTIENGGVDDVFLIQVGGGSQTIKNNIIRNNTGIGNAGGIGLQGFGEVVNTTIENNLIHNVNGPGIGNGPFSNAIILNNEIWECNGGEGPGIGLYGFATPTIVNNTIFNNNRAGIGSYGDGLNAGGGDLSIPVIKGNTIYNNTQAGIRLSRAGGDTGTITVIIGDVDSGNEIYGNQAGIRLDGLTNGTIENNNIHDQNLSGIRLDGVTTATIHNNQINSQQMAGIRLDNIDDITISDNDIQYSNIMAGIRFYSNVVKATVVNNQIHENGQAGIRNTGAATLNVQDNNDIFLNSKGGIFIDSEGSTNTIQENTIRDNLFGGIRVASANSVTVQNNNQIYGNSYGGINNEGTNDLTVSGNQIYGNGYGGINIQSGIGTITQNTIEQNSRGGIGIKAPCTFEITGNQITGNMRGGMHTGDDSVDGGYTGAVGDAHLTIKKNKVYGNGQSGFGGGIDVRHADGVIYNNLVYKNYKGGIRFGDDIDEIVNNTVVGNGDGENDMGGGIVYDDLSGAVNEDPSGEPSSDIPIINNISVYNEKAGIRTGVSYCMNSRDYNLLCRNNGTTVDTCNESYPCIRRSLGGCDKNSNEIFNNPLFVDPDNDDYHLQSGSPAKNAGDDLNDMGAYGGSDPITP